MELIGWMTQSKDRKQQQLAFLAPFLDDAEVRDETANPKMFEGPYAGFTFPKLAVQDMAAMQCAFLLGMPDVPDASWSKEQWAKLRARVQKALQP